MRYTSFIITNYKGIKQLTIDLESKPNCPVFTFVGLNESGKTTILEAINTINSGYQKDNEHTFIPKNQKANFTGRVSVEAIIEVDDDDNRRISEFVKTLGYEYWKPIKSYEINACCEFENSKLKQRMNYWGIITKVKKTNRHKMIIELDEKQGDWHKIVDYMSETLMPRIVYYENFLFKFPEKIYLSGNKASTPENIKYKTVFEDILQETIPNGSIETSIVDNYLATDSGSRDIFDAITSKLEDKITTDVFSSWGKLFNTIDYKPQIALRFGTNTTLGEEGCYVEMKIKENGDFFYISERSLGFQWFFTFLFFTLFRINRQSDFGETIFLFDEPASNLHSTAQKRLLHTFARFVEDEKKPVKLLYTTHSHHLINPKWLEGAFIVKNSAIDYADISTNSSNTDISAYTYKYFASQYPTQKDYFQPILDSLDYQPGLLELVPNIIITEGKSDYYILRYFNEIMFDNKYPNINLYPGSGCTKNFQTIALYLAWGRKFIIVLDGDTAGVKSKKEYIKEFGAVVEQNIVVYGDLVPEIENNVVEDIFTSQEKIDITQLFDEKSTEFKKSAFNTEIQTSFINKTTINISQETKDKFDKLLSRLNDLIQTELL